MAPIKSALSRALRSKVPGAASARAGIGAYRGITATAKDAASLVSSPQPERQTPSKPAGPSSNLSSKDVSARLFLPRPSPAPFDDLLNALTKTLTMTTKTSLPQLHNLLRSYTSNSDHWAKFAHKNPSKQYTRNLVCDVPGVFNLLILVWSPGKKSPVHDHADAHCLMKVLQGSLQETRYVIPTNPGKEGPLVETSNLSFGLNKVSYMADTVCGPLSMGIECANVAKLGLHSIANPSLTEYAVSLHLYFPPNAALRGARIFDVESGEAKLVQGGYDSVEGRPFEG